MDDHPSWAECTKEAVAERLADLGGVTVVSCVPDEPQQVGMDGYGPKVAKTEPPKKQAAKAKVVRQRVVKCPDCGREVRELECSDGVTRRCESMARCYQAQGPEEVVTTAGEVRTGAFDGRGYGPTGLGYREHKCKGGNEYGV